MYIPELLNTVNVYIPKPLNTVSEFTPELLNTVSELTPPVSVPQLLDAAGRTAAGGAAAAAAGGSAGGAAPARSSDSGAEQDAAVLRRLREMAAGLDQGVLRSVKQYGRAGNQCGLAVKRNQSGRAVKQYGRAANRSGHAVDRSGHAVDQGWQSLNPIGHVMPAYLDAAAKLMHSRIVALAKLLAEGQVGVYRCRGDRWIAVSYADVFLLRERS